MGSLDGTLKEFFKALDRKDFATLLKMVDKSAEGIDEITKGWIRGKAAFEGYVKRVEPELRNVKSHLEDVHTRRVGGVGIATFILRQSYTLSGQRHDLKLASSMAFAKRGDNWKATLVHMTPLGD